MDKRYIYLVFSKTDTWLSKLIRVFSNIKYVHASISLDDSFTQMYSFGRRNPDQPFSGGFAIENLYEGVYKKSTKCECLIYRIEVTEEQYQSLHKQISEFMKKRDRLRYSLLGVVGVRLNVPIKRKNHYFCSQFVSKILIESKVLECGKKPELITSNDLMISIQNKDIIWQGFINDYYHMPVFGRV